MAGPAERGVRPDASGVHFRAANGAVQAGRISAINECGYSGCRRHSDAAQTSGGFRFIQAAGCRLYFAAISERGYRFLFASCKSKSNRHSYIVNPCVPWWFLFWYTVAALLQTKWQQCGMEAAPVIV